MTASFHQLHNLKRPSPSCCYTFSQAAVTDLLAVLLRASLVSSCQHYPVRLPISLAALRIASVVRVHTAADTETVGFSAAGVDEGQMGKEGGGA